MRALRYILFAICSVSALCISAQEPSSISYVPRIGGVIRGRWEMLTDGGLNKFALRNARVNLRGYIAPTIDYFFQGDLCNNGKSVFLDGWARFTLFNSLKIRAGQFRIPFGVDPFRSPATYIFANRSFIGRDLDNIRAVGVSVAYSVPRIPLTLEAGVFNPNTINDHSEWSHDKVFASKASLRLDPITLTGGFQTIIPDSVRINMADVAVTFNHGRWLAEVEYMYKHYTGNTHDDCHAYNAFVDYSLPIKTSLFERLSVQARADGSTPHSTGYRNADGKLVDNQPYRNRLTVGATLTYKFERVRCDLRINYENYFYHHDYIVSDSRNDRVTAELVLVF